MTSQQGAEPGTGLATQEQIDKLPTTAGERRAIADSLSVWGGEWSTIDKLQPKDAARVARVIITAFPEFTALEVTSYFDLIGGKIRPTAEFWIHRGQEHPAFRGLETRRIARDSDEWGEWLGDQDPEHIAAAVLCLVHRADRPRPVVEANYVLDTDPILYESVFESLGPQENKAAAVAEAMRRDYPVDRAEIFFVSRGSYWACKWRDRIPDYHAKAMKKARTTAAGRAFKKAFSMLEAKVAMALHTIDHQIHQAALASEREHAGAHLIGGGVDLAVRAGGGPSVATRDGVDAYSDNTRPSRRRGPEVEVHPVASDTTKLDSAEPQDPASELEEQRAAERAQHYITEAERRKLYLHLAPRNISLLGVDSDHEALHVILSRVRGLHPEAKVSTKEITYAELEAVVAAIEALPFEDNKP